MICNELNKFRLCLFLNFLVLFQVEYMFYSRTEAPKSRITKDDEEKYLNNGYVKVEESAMCAVRTY